MGGLPTTVSRAGLRRALRVGDSTLFLACVLTVVTWPFSTGTLLPVIGDAGVDSSWQGLLARVPWSGLSFGSRVDFTYGPLGFLTVQKLYEPVTAILAFIFALALLVSLNWLLVHHLRRGLPLPIAVALAYVAGGLAIAINADTSFEYGFASMAPQFTVALVLSVAVYVMTLPAASSADYPWRELTLLGALAGGFGLVQMTLPVVFAGVIVATLACAPALGNARDRARSLVLVCSAALVVFVVAWLCTGNDLSAVPRFLTSSAAIDSGYASAMGSASDGTLRDQLAAIAVVVLLGYAIFAFTVGYQRRVRLGAVAATAWTVWALIREAFTRGDADHLAQLFSVVPFLLVIFLLPDRRRFKSDLTRRSNRLLGAGLLLISVETMLLAIPGAALTFSPLADTRALADEITTLSSSGRRDQIIAQGRSGMRQYYGVPASMIRLMRGNSVDVDPTNQNVTWAYSGLVPDPLPVIQDYSAYTPSLDTLDAHDLGSSNAPTYILSQFNGTIDDRLPSWDPPQTQLVIECRYAQVMAATGWQLLRRVPDRCGPPRFRAAVSTEEMATVRVPRVGRGEALVARFSLPSSLSLRIRDLLYWPPVEYCLWTVSASGQPGGWRFIPGTASDLHIVETPATLGYAPKYRPLQIASFRLGTCNAVPGELRVAFYTIKMRAS